MKKALSAILFLLFSCQTFAQNVHLNQIPSPQLFKGNETTAYRDPAVIFNDGWFHLFFTVTEIERDGKIFSYTSTSMSDDLIHWTTPRKLTPRDQRLNYSSPGNIIKFKNEWLLCLQTYPRPDYEASQMPKYGDQTARLFIMRSIDLQYWSKPELIKVKGAAVPESEMGRMIDPYLLQDKDQPTKYWCFYKQNGVSISYTYDFENWTWFGRTEAGENVCVLTDSNQYVMLHSPSNGIGIKRSENLVNWFDQGSLITLGQNEWTWAKGRITAGTVIKLKDNPDAKFLMFFHGSGPLKEKEGDFDKNASIGIAWSNDLQTWNWPGKTN